MTLRELYDIVLIEIGQYLVKDVVEVDIDKFKKLVDASIGVYNNYVPFHDKKNIHINSLNYEFAEIWHPQGIPDWISDVVPVRMAGVTPWYFRSREELDNAYLTDKKSFPWDYRKPVLYVPINSLYDVECVWNHKMVEIPGNDLKKKDWDLPTLSYNDDEFIDLVSGKCMKSLGRSRRAFTINELPITTDAADLVAEGQALEDSTQQELRDNKMKFWLAYR